MLWLQPEGDDIKNPVMDALEVTKTYMRTINDSVEFDLTKQKLLNAIFSTCVDAYIDRFIIAANSSLKLKLYQGFPDPGKFSIPELASQKLDRKF